MRGDDSCALRRGSPYLSRDLARDGIPRPTLFRPPYGRYDDQTLRILRRRGFRLVTVPQLLLRTKVPREQEYVAPSSAA